MQRIGDITVASHGVGDSDKCIGGVIGEEMSVESVWQEIFNDSVEIDRCRGVADG